MQCCCKYCNEVLAIRTQTERAAPEIHLPDSWDEAAHILSAHGPEAAVAGGATYLMWQRAHGRALPRHLVSLHRIANHAEVAANHVGALASLRSIERGPADGAHRVLSMAASVAAGPSVRTVATLGGNLASAFPHADLVPALLALDARVHLYDGGILTVSEMLGQGLQGRLVTGVSYPDGEADDGWTGASVKLSRRGMDLSVVLASVAVQTQEQQVTQARIGVGSLCDRPLRLSKLEEAIIGAAATPDGMTDALRFEDWLDLPFREDHEATAEYRQRVATPVLRRALSLALRLGSKGASRTGEARI